MVTISKPNRPVTMEGRNNSSIAADTEIKRIQLSRAWYFHFCLSVLVILAGIVNNGGTRKLIPIKSIQTEFKSCARGFLNVLAVGEDSEDAFVCCEADSSHFLCSKSVAIMPFAKRLSKLPEAWLLPLFPFLVKFFISLFHYSAGYTASWNFLSVEGQRRLYMYLGLIQYRGFVLYIVLNAIEKYFIFSAADGDCWYQTWLSKHHGSCHGHIFDFSDHAVLFFGQLLPIALTEVLHLMSTTKPLWDTSISARFGWWHSRIMLTMLIYLYIITMIAAYKTAAYFHSGGEMMLGYLISLSVQIPLFLIQCTDVWPSTSKILFG